jgi:hypothetical protein
MKKPNECPALSALADGCMRGACNPGALIRAFGRAIDELPPVEVAEHPAVKVILGQISYLAGESLGPSIAALDAYRAWLSS